MAAYRARKNGKSAVFPAILDDAVGDAVTEPGRFVSGASGTFAPEGAVHASSLPRNRDERRRRGVRDLCTAARRELQ